jgi:hypothetical protein
VTGRESFAAEIGRIEIEARTGYYSMLFEDPDGIRLEINHVPGRGVFKDKAD